MSVKINLPCNGWKLHCLLVAIDGADGLFKAFLDSLEGDQLVDVHKTIVRASTLSTPLQWILADFLDHRRSCSISQTRAKGLMVCEF